MIQLEKTTSLEKCLFSILWQSHECAKKITVNTKPLFPNTTKEEWNPYKTSEEMTAIWFLLQTKELPWLL